MPRTFDCIEVRQDVCPIQKDYTFYYDDMRWWSTKNIMHKYFVSPATKVKGDKGGHFNVQGTISNWSDNVGSLCFSCQKQHMYSRMNMPYLRSG
jgi:hypothetical protein